MHSGIFEGLGLASLEHCQHLYTGSSMAAIDETALPVALPAIQSALGATAVDAQWVVAAYTLLLAALILIGSSLGDHLGRASVKKGLASGSLDA